jgi:hypothetical protein
LTGSVGDLFGQRREAGAARLNAVGLDGGGPGQPGAGPDHPLQEPDDLRRFPVEAGGPGRFRARAGGGGGARELAGEIGGPRTEALGARAKGFGLPLESVMRGEQGGDLGVQTAERMAALGGTIGRVPASLDRRPSGAEVFASGYFPAKLSRAACPLAAQMHRPAYRVDEK